MSDEIRQGDRVRDHGGFRLLAYGDGTVLGLHTNAKGAKWAWVEYDDGACFASVLSDLTRIEPEPVTLTPKYKVGQPVIVKGTPDVFAVAGISVLYHDKEGSCHRESELEPEPKPCPACKGTGKQEGSA